MKTKWPTVQLGEICEIRTGKKDVNQGNPDGKYPFFTCAANPSRSDSFSFDTEAILVAGNGNVGQTNYFNGKFEAYQRTYVLSDFVRINPQYLNYVVGSGLKPHLSKQSMGNTIPYIKLGMLKSFPIPLPPLDEQKRIVAKLDAAQQEFDRLNNNLEQQLIQLTEFDSALLSEMLISPNQTPEPAVTTKWPLVRFEDVIHAYQPETLSVKELDAAGSFPVYGANGIIGRHSSYNHEDSELTMTCRGATCGSLNVTLPKSWINGNAMVLKPKTSDLDRDYLRFALSGGVDVGSVITGAAQPQITRASLHTLSIPLPPLDEQKRIVAKLDEASAQSTLLRANIVDRKKSASELQSSLLAAALAGAL